MKRFGLTPLLVLAAIATAMLVAGHYTPHFPGDPEVSRLIQRAPGGNWARAVTRAASVPWIYGVLAVAVIAAVRVAGWRAALAMIVTFFVFMYAEQPIKNYIGRARPSPELMRAASASTDYSMPSGWALKFGSTVGLLLALAWAGMRGVSRTVYVAGCALVLIAGLMARVSLGAHWPSDVIAGYLLAIAVGLALVELLASIGPKSR